MYEMYAEIIKTSELHFENAVVTFQCSTGKFSDFIFHIPETVRHTIKKVHHKIHILRCTNYLHLYL